MPDVAWKKSSLIKKLKQIRSPDAERGGFILSDGTIVGCENRAEDKANAYIASSEDILKHCNDAVATWHTHAGSSNLSAEDFKTFIEWPNLEHIIVGSDGVRFYVVKGRAVVNSPAPTPKPRSKK